MKKIIAFVCTIILVCALSVSVFAEGESVVGIETNANAVTNVTTVEETATAGEISGDRAMQEITTELIVGWVKVHFEEITVIISLILTAFYNIRKHKQINRSISATNQNAITVSENSEQTIQHALFAMAEYKKAAEEEKQKLEQTLNEAMTYINASKLANIEFANELAELLTLANIPNAKKDELYSRHIAAVKMISETEKTEVNTDADGKET
jgi:hypothetical protein